MSKIKIGVISDTHITEGGRRVLPPRLWDDFAGVELILHAGDLVAPRVITELETIAPVLAVAGNNDAPAPNLPLFRRLELGGLIVGLAHGDRFATVASDSPSPSAPARTLARASGARASRKPLPRAARVAPLPLPFSGNGQTSAFALSHVPDAQVMIFGHSHRPLIVRARLGGDLFDQEREVLLLNPGSPTDKRWSEHWGVAILEIEGRRAHAHALLW